MAAGVSDRLDQLKAAYHALPGALTRVVEAELARIPRALSHNLTQQTWTCVYVPQARALRFYMRYSNAFFLFSAADIRKVVAWKWLPPYYKGDAVRSDYAVLFMCECTECFYKSTEGLSIPRGTEIPRCIGKSGKEGHCVYANVKVLMSRWGLPSASREAG